MTIDTDKLKKLLAEREKKVLSSIAAKSEDGHRRITENKINFGYRQSFSIDADRIISSHSYTRYIDKTQVFSLIQNDHIAHRVLHVQLVSKIGRTIGRFLGLNEDLIEAISLGHDIGHTAFGHDGERILSKICQNSGLNNFRHNVQSVHFLDKVENKGQGWNLCLQTLDGILCHNGEIHNQKLTPDFNKTYDIFENQIIQTLKDKSKNFVPMTLEGCVVRFVDTISYVGRDIEDAIRLKLIKRSDLPSDCINILGNTNGTIVYNLVTDIIKNSYNKPYIVFSDKVSEALKKIKIFNLEYIYFNKKIKKHLKIVEEMFNILFERYCNDLIKKNNSSVIFKNFLEDMSEEYINSLSNEEIVRDFISGMTDQYFLKQFPKDKRPDFLQI